MQKDLPPFQRPERAGLLGEYAKQKGGFFPPSSSYKYHARRSMDQRTLSTTNFERSLDATMSSASDTKALGILKGPEDWLT